MHVNNPSGLWALAGLLIPVVIHLLSRQEGRTIAIGSIRHLNESPTARFRHIRPNELALFALRCLLIFLFALILADLRWNIGGREKKKWVLVEKGIPNEGPINALIDTLKSEGFEARLLSKGFPLLKDSARDFGPSEHWFLAEELGRQRLDSAVVLAFNHYQNFRGTRADLPDHVRWLGIESSEVEFVAQEIATSNDSSWVRRGFTSNAVTHFQTVKQKMSSGADAAIDINIQIVSTEDFSFDKKIVMAALKAIQATTPHRINITPVARGETTNSNGSKWIVWLSDSTFTATPKHQSILYKRCAGKHLPLLTPAGSAKFFCGESDADWVITSRLDEEIAVHQNFTQTLASIILPSTPSISDNRVLPEAMLWSRAQRSAVSNADAAQSAETLLIVLLLSILAIERWLAFKKHQ